MLTPATIVHTVRVKQILDKKDGNKTEVKNKEELKEFSQSSDLAPFPRKVQRVQYYTCSLSFLFEQRKGAEICSRCRASDVRYLYGRELLAYI